MIWQYSSFTYVKQSLAAVAQVIKKYLEMDTKYSIESWAIEVQDFKEGIYYLVKK